ncbi:MAG: DNA replication and repair protein RecF [Prevotellaceae bacterium]|jgi:DNA replication and repair protein RecF|nr:DNA replication and repair protein RecF [Prevotellaceae bacterium]
MQLNKLSIVNYKNIRQAELEFSPKINCFIGNNGVGKTNVLDAIYYLSFCKSHSASIDSQNINHNEVFFVLEGFYTRNGVEEDIYCALKQRLKKVFKRNKRDYERITEHIGLLPLVLISPDDSGLIGDGSGERRKFIDGVISQYDRFYLNALLRYNNTITQRNALLKNEVIDAELLDILNLDLVESGEFIYEKRREFIREFIPVFQKYYNFIAENKETVDLSYVSHLDKGDFTEMLRDSLERDKILGYTTKGIHKDDLEMTLGEFPIRREGSQGQNKTYVIAMKLAQFDFLKRVSGVNPLLLLDDIFDKLDAERVKQIIKLVSEDYFGQIFITDTNRKHLDEILGALNENYNLFLVDNGEIFLQ